MRNISDKRRRENQNTHFVFSNFFRQSCGLWDNVEKILQRRTLYRWKYGVCALHAGYLRLHIHTLRLCNTHCFSTATMVARTRVNVTLYVLCLMMVEWTTETC